MSIERIFAVLLAGLLGFGGFGSLPGLCGQPAGAGVQTDTESCTRRPSATSALGRTASTGTAGGLVAAVALAVAAGLLLG
ncbi:hypothetical protein Psed_0319 [Pseudonocardia dioxanivorans CB1190]|uniref:Uncharacterized protein n=1 Tax=Pseudonocardia dioxanivorans (strain ATCC 55486 / DSM 44775 / JCM 13855 / CB1190) TaxID=675635 RepID=F4CQJ4_PSEUX|nr:hypothetical protein [Pseudonocardia dioxanivorans]AEA22592.1 hypothetical protein Psed_0319 [Pseudonocardia dioxanivorans CB1190]